MAKFTYIAHFSSMALMYHGQKTIESYPPNKRMQMDLAKRYALASATDARRYKAQPTLKDRKRLAGKG